MFFLVNLRGPVPLLSCSRLRLLKEPHALSTSLPLHVFIYNSKIIVSALHREWTSHHLGEVVNAEALRPFTAHHCPGFPIISSQVYYEAKKITLMTMSSEVKMNDFELLHLLASFPTETQKTGCSFVCSALRCC